MGSLLRGCWWGNLCLWPLGIWSESFEDSETNRMQESLQMLKSISRCGWFKDCSVMLFLNKQNLFAEEIGSTHSENPLKVPLSVCFPDCPIHQNPYKHGLHYIRDQFVKRLDKRKKPDFYVHISCAIDKSNIETAFINIHHLLIIKAMRKSGLLWYGAVICLPWLGLLVTTDILNYFYVTCNPACFLRVCPFFSRSPAISAIICRTFWLNHEVAGPDF
jgi:hypothetical protein